MGFQAKVTAFCVATLLLCSMARAQVIETPKGAEAGRPEIAIMLPGTAHDNGFMEAGHRGYERIASELTTRVKCLSAVSATSEKGALTEALRSLAAERPKLIIAHGGQCNEPVRVVGKEHPEIRFVVIQGAEQGPNISSYKVEQEDSAFLAGALAGYLTKTCKVGHISGAWPKPGLAARAAFYQGLIHTRPDAVFYSHFTGNLDDQGINAKAAEAEIAAGCDIIYTMLNGGREGVNKVIAASRGRVKEIGNVIDWTAVSPIFIGSAVADASVAMYNAAADYKEGRLQMGAIRSIGAEEEAVVRLALSKKVPKKVALRLEKLKEELLSGQITLGQAYTGPEFDPGTGEFVSQEAKLKKK